MKSLRWLLPMAVAVVSCVAVLPAQAQSEPPRSGDALFAPPPTRITRSASTTPDRYAPSAFLAGRVAVQLIFVESTGQRQPSTENWAEAQRTAITAQVQQALDWWQARVPNARVSLDLRVVNANTGYEPITLTLNEEKLWASEAFASLGFTGNNYFEQAYSADESLRREQNADWATTIFAINSEADADGRFADGQFAYAYVGGPFLVVTSDASAYGTNRLAPVVGHEFGHIFGALDQYQEASTPCTVKSGYLGVANTNSQYQNCGSKNPSIMWDPVGAFQANAVEASALGQIGYRDGDGDNIPDPLDTAPTLEVAINQATGSRPQLSARAIDQPFASPFQRSMSINTIERVEFRADGGEWAALPAADGAYDSTDELLNTPLPLYDGMHTVELRAINRVGASSPVATQQVQVSGVGAQPNVNITVSALQNTTTTSIGVEAPAGFDLRVSERADFAGATWQPAQATNSFELAPTDGKHMLYIGLRDAQGLEMPITQRQVTLDRAAPTGSASLQNAAGETLIIQAEDAGSGLDAMAMVDANGVNGPWQSFSATVALSPEASPSAIRLRDRAGNISPPLAVQHPNTVYVPFAAR